MSEILYNVPDSIICMSRFWDEYDGSIDVQCKYNARLLFHQIGMITYAEKLCLFKDACYNYKNKSELELETLYKSPVLDRFRTDNKILIGTYNPVTDTYDINLMHFFVSIVIGCNNALQLLREFSSEIFQLKCNIRVYYKRPCGSNYSVIKIGKYRGKIKLLCTDVMENLFAYINNHVCHPYEHRAKNHTMLMNFIQHRFINGFSIPVELLASMILGLDYDLNELITSILKNRETICKNAVMKLNLKESLINYDYSAYNMYTTCNKLKYWMKYFTERYLKLTNAYELQSHILKNEYDLYTEPSIVNDTTLDGDEHYEVNTVSNINNTDVNTEASTNDNTEVNTNVNTEVNMEVNTDDVCSNATTIGNYSYLSDFSMGSEVKKYNLRSYRRTN